MYDTIKIIDLNPAIPEDQIYDLLCEKFSKFPSASINIVQQENDRVAYIRFRTARDATKAMKQNSCVVLFGYACRSVPVYGQPQPGNNYPATDQYSSNLVGYADFPAEGHEQRSLSPEEPDLLDRPQRSSDGYRRRGQRGARLGLSNRFYTGFGSARGRGRWSRHNAVSSRGRGAQRPYLLKSRDSPERKSEMPLAGGSDNGQKEYESTLPASPDDMEVDPNSTLYIGSMDATVKEIDLMRLFNNFGYVLCVEIKKPSAVVCFAFVHFLTMDMARLAKQEMDGKPIGRTVPKLGYGKNVESKCLWVGGLGKWTSEDTLLYEFAQFGQVEKVDWPKNRDYAYVLFMQVQDAIDAKQVMHGSRHGDPPHRLRICYASNVQMMSPYNRKDEFPKFPKQRIVPRMHTFNKMKRRSPDRQSQERHRKQRRSPERSRSRSRHRKSHSHVRPRKKSRKSPSPYARSISQASSDNDHLSAISNTTSESAGSPERGRRRKKHRKLSVSRSPPVSKLLRNPSPPKLMKKDERTVVLRSEPRSEPHSEPKPASVATSGIYTSVSNPMYRATAPYASSVDPGMYYPPVASSLPPPIFPPPVHLPPPDYYMQPTPMMPPPYQQHLQPLASYPPIATDTKQPVPVVGHSSVPPAETTNTPPVVEKPRQDTTPVKKPATVSFATQFPKVWSGALVLRNAAFVVDFHLLSGSVMLVNSLLGTNVEPGSEDDCPVLKIAQRLRLDQPDKLDELDRRLKQAGRTGCSVLLATSTLAQVDDDANVVQQYPLSSLVSYLLQKQVAAVVSLPPGTADPTKATGVLHAFPSSKFATDFLQREAPDLPTTCPTEEELLVILCKF